eukprot:3420440-Lingulodinium_polyedra.AAC.1
MQTSFRVLAGTIKGGWRRDNDNQLGPRSHHGELTVQDLASASGVQHVIATQRIYALMPPDFGCPWPGHHSAQTLQIGRRP